MNKYPILTFIGIVAVIIGLIALGKNWDQVAAYIKSFSSPAPQDNTTASAQRSSNNSTNKIICEYINNQGQMIRSEGYGEAFAEECRRKTQRDYIYQNNYAYYPYRYWYWNYPTYYYTYPWSNNFGITTNTVTF